MIILPYGFLTHAAERIAEREARIAGMIACFSTHGVVEADAQLAESVTRPTQDWVRSQLAQPETATFYDQEARLHPDNVVLLVGRVESQSVTGRTCNNWYIVQLDLVKQQADGAMLDSKPPMQPVVPMPAMPGTQLPYQGATSTQPLPETPKPTYWGTNLLIALAIALVVLIVGVIAGIL